HCNGGLFAFEVARRLVAEGDKVDALVIIDASARNARYRLVSRLARVLAWIGRLDGQAEARLFLSLRAHVTDLASGPAGWRRRLAVPPAAAPGEDLDLV